MVLTRAELRLPLLHYRASRAQVKQTIESHCSLTLTAIVLMRAELQLPLVHCRASRAQVIAL